MNLKCFFFFLGVCLTTVSGVLAQTGKDSLVVYYYPNGKASSQGRLVNGKPDGYWKTWYENGALKSEGNRLNFKLDSLWKFYSPDSLPTTFITYKEGKKNGIRTLFDEGGKKQTEEKFLEDIKQGETRIYHTNGTLRQAIQFVDGKEQGLSYEYSSIGVVLTIIEYKNGYKIRNEKVNRIDKFGQRQGMQVEFFPNGKIETECNYENDKRNGYLKVYDEEGNLLSTTKYVDDMPVMDAQETAKLDIKREYYDNAKEKSIGSYKNGVPEGVTRYYDESGKVVSAKLFKEGLLLGEGVVDGLGLKQGKWKEFHETGELRAEGAYVNNKRVGPWKFYFKNGQAEQNGTYADGKPDGKWTWYFQGGGLRREENYYKGLEDGESVEYNDSGKVVTKGSYIEGEKEGLWEYENGDFKEVGSYKAGSQEGEWKAFYNDGKPLYEVKFLGNRMIGKYLSYWPNGKVKEFGKYTDGNREGDWIRYSEDGTQYLVITFKDGLEVRYEGTKSDVETGAANPSTE
jgi:antitoxin component YwqK of YwqJK toxin-antitoxin module